MDHSSQVFTPPPKGRQESPDQAPLKVKVETPSPNTQIFPRPSKSDTHLDRRLTAFAGKKPASKEVKISAHNENQKEKIKELIKRVDKFRGQVDKAKPAQSKVYDLQITELEELIQKQEEVIDDLGKIEEQLDGQMKTVHYLEWRRPVQQMPSFEKYEVSAAYLLNKEHQKTERMFEELLERGSKLKSTDFIKVIKMKQTIRKTLEQKFKQKTSQDF